MCINVESRALPSSFTQVVFYILREVADFQVTVRIGPNEWQHIGGGAHDTAESISSTMGAQFDRSGPASDVAIVRKRFWLSRDSSAISSSFCCTLCVAAVNYDTLVLVAVRVELTFMRSGPPGRNSLP